MSTTILIVEDDVAFRDKVLKPPLEERGYEVMVAGKVREALHILDERKADVLIVDGLLPDRTGIDLIQFLRNAGDQTPVVFLSAFWKDLKTYNKLMRMGVSHVLSKPVNTEDLCAKVDALTGKTGS